MAVYERLIQQGIREADERGSAVDHVTARRMAIWLVPRSREEPHFISGLITFVRSGAISRDLKDRLRHHARSDHPNRKSSGRLLQYVIARGTDLGPIGENFGGACDQLDYADAMLADLRDRAYQARWTLQPEPAASHEAEPFALARYEPGSRTVSFILDADTANAAMHAISTTAADREARTRETQLRSADFPEGSYGRTNRETIAVQETRTTTRLRAVERAYQAAHDLDANKTADHSQVPRFATPPADRDLEME